MGNACKKHDKKEEDENVAFPKRYFQFSSKQKPEYVYKKQANLNILNNKFTHISSKKQYNENICQVLNIPVINLDDQQYVQKQLEIKLKNKQRRKRRGEIGSGIASSSLSFQEISLVQTLVAPKELRLDFLSQHQLLEHIITLNLVRKFQTHYLEPQPFANNFQQQMMKKEYSPLRSMVVLDHQIKEKPNCEVWECFARNDIQRRFQLKIFRGPENYINKKFDIKKAYYHSIDSLKEDQVVKSSMMYIDKHEIFLEDSPFLLMEVKQCSVLTLEDLLQMRKIKNHYYSTEEIIYFFNIFVEIILDAQTNNIYHGNLSLDKICLYFNLDKEINYEFVEQCRQQNKFMSNKQIELSYADEQIQYKIKHFLYYQRLAQTNQILVRPDIEKQIEKINIIQEKLKEDYMENELKQKRNTLINTQQLKTIQENHIDNNSSQYTEEDDEEDSDNEQSEVNSNNNNENQDIQQKKQLRNQNKTEENQLQNSKFRRKGVIRVRTILLQRQDKEEEKLIEFLHEQELKEQQEAKLLLEKQKWLEEQNQREYKPPRYWPPHLKAKLQQQTFITLQEIQNADIFSIGLMILSLMRLEPISTDYNLEYLKMDLERYEQKYPLLCSLVKKLLKNSEKLPNLRQIKQYIQNFRMAKPANYKYYMEYLKNRSDNSEINSKNAIELFLQRELHFSDAEQELLLKIKKIHKKAVSYFHLKNFDRAKEMIEQIFTASESQFFVKYRMQFTYKCQLDFHHSFALLKMSQFEVASGILMELHTQLVKLQLQYDEIKLFLKCLYYLAYNNFLMQSPETSLSYLSKLEELMRNNKIDDAKSYLMLYTLRSHVLSDRNQYQDAYYALLPILTNSTNNTQVSFTKADRSLTLFYAGQLLHQLGDTKKGTELMQKSLEAHAESSIKIMRYGCLTEMAEQQNDPVAMDEYLENAVYTITSMSVNDKNLEITANWANLYTKYLAMNKQKFSQFDKFLSLSYAKNADQICYSSDFLYYCIGITCFFLSHYQLACQNFIVCLQIKGEMSLYRCLSVEWLGFIQMFYLNQNDQKKAQLQGKSLYQHAINEYDNFVRVHPTYEFYVTFRKMIIYIAMKKFSKALLLIDQLDKQLTSIPRDQLMNSQLSLIRALVNLHIGGRKFFDIGEKIIQQTIEFLYSNFPNQPQVFINFVLQSVVYILQINQFSLALKILEETLPKFEETRQKLSDTTDFLALYGYLLLVNDQRKKAFSYFKQVLADLQIQEDKHSINIQICQRQSALIEIIGRLLLQQGKVSESLACLIKSIHVLEFFIPKRDTDEFAFKFLNLANIYMLLGHYEQALKYCELGYTIFLSSQKQTVKQQIFFCIAKKCEIQLNISDRLTALQSFEDYNKIVNEIFDKSCPMDLQMKAYDSKLQAKLNLRIANYSQCLKCLEDAIYQYSTLYGSKDLSVIELLLLVAETYYGLKNIVQAQKKIVQIEKLLQTQIKQGRVDPNILVQADLARITGKIYYLDKKYKQAIECFNKADELYQIVSQGQIFSVAGDDQEKILNKNPLHCEIQFYKAECKYAELVQHFKEQTNNGSLRNIIFQQDFEDISEAIDEDKIANQLINNQQQNKQIKDEDQKSEKNSVASQKQIIIDSQESLNIFEETEKLIILFYQGKSPFLPIINFERAKINYLTNNFYDHLFVMTNILPTLGFDKWVIQFLINQRANRDNDLRRQFNIYCSSKNQFLLQNELQLYIKKFNFFGDQNNKENQKEDNDENINQIDQELYKDDMEYRIEQLRLQMEGLKIKYLKLDSCLDHLKFARDMGSKYFPSNCDFLKQVEQHIIFINNQYNIKPMQTQNFKQISNQFDSQEENFQKIKKYSKSF